MDIKEIENLQNESGLFNLDDIQTLFYEVSYYQDINEENILKEKESKKESNSYAEIFNEYNRILPGYAVSIRNLEEEVAKIDDKQQHLGGRISEKDKTRKNQLLEQIEDLKKKYQEDRINREEARKGHKEAKEENEKAKMINEEALAKKQLESFKNKIVSIYKYCLSKNKEIDDKLAVMEFLINNETNMDRKVQYSLEYYNLGKLKINTIENYRAVIDKIKGSEVYDDIKSSIGQAEVEVQNQQLEGFYDEEVRQLQSGYKTVEEPVVPLPENTFEEPVVENMESPVIEEPEQPTITMPEFSFDDPTVEPVENVETPEISNVSEVIEPVAPLPEDTFEEPVVEEQPEEIKLNKEKNKKKHSLLGLFSLKNIQEENMINEEPMDGIISNEESQQPVEKELPTITMPEFSFEEPTVEEMPKEEIENNTISEEPQEEIERPTITMPEFSFDDSNVEEVSKETPQEEDNFMNPFEKFNYSDNKEDEILNSEVKPEAILGEDEWTDTKEDLPLEEKVQSSDDNEISNQQVEEASSADALDKFNSMFDNIDNSTNLKEIEPMAITNVKDAPNEFVDNAKTKFQKMWFGDNYDTLKEQGKIR